jgi:hypothetical protein
MCDGASCGCEGDVCEAESLDSPADTPVDEAACDEEPCPSPAGSALRFDGSQIVRVAPGPVDDMTIEMWLKTTRSFAGNGWYNGGALYQADTSGPTDDYGASLVGDKFTFGTGNPDVTVTSTTSVNTGAWFHVAATRVKSTGVVRVFVNGNVETIVATGNTSSLNKIPSPWIGAVLDNDMKVIDSFEGTLDELRVWNVARTAAEIASTMHFRLRGDEPGLVGYWRFDDGTGATAADASPSHNDGALGNGYPEHVPTWVPSDAPIESEPDK